MGAAESQETTHVNVQANYGMDAKDACPNKFHVATQPVWRTHSPPNDLRLRSSRNSTDEQTMSSSDVGSEGAYDTDSDDLPVGTVYVTDASTQTNPVCVEGMLRRSARVAQTELDEEAVHKIGCASRCLGCQIFVTC